MMHRRLETSMSPDHSGVRPLVYPLIPVRLANQYLSKMSNCCNKLHIVLMETLNAPQHSRSGLRVSQG